MLRHVIFFPSIFFLCSFFVLKGGTLYVHVFEGAVSRLSCCSYINWDPAPLFSNTYIPILGSPQPRARLCCILVSAFIPSLNYILKVPTVGVYVMRRSSFVLIIKNGVKRENNSLQSSICTREGGQCPDYRVVLI